MQQKTKRGGKRTGSGRKPKPHKAMSFYLALDVFDILNEQENQTAYIEDAVREKYIREANKSVYK